MGNKDVLCDWFDDETWQMCPGENDRLRGGHKKIKLNKDDRNSADISCPKSHAKIPSQLSTVDSMSKTSLENLVYKRRKLHGNSSSHTLGKRSGDCFSIDSCNTSLVAPNENSCPRSPERGIEAIGSRSLSQILNPKVAKGPIGNEGLVGRTKKGSVQRIFEVDSVNDSCSSSKSNVDPTIKVESDEASECSSCSIVGMKYAEEDLSEKEFCISVLRSHGLLTSDCTTKAFESPEHITSDGGSNVQPCNVCSLSNITTKLLICDNCEKAFHMYCCKPRIKKVPIDDWFCHSCVKKGCKILNDKVTRKFPSIKRELNGSKRLSPKGITNAIGLMLRKSEPYTTSVRIGKAFQAEVPEWSSPIENDKGAGEPLEIDESEYLTFHESTPYKTSESGPLSNWLQCQAVSDASEDDLKNETICGKWRRAPLFEIQTDDWECFCSIRWDPAQSDCAVPQEVGTAEVLRQLKCIEKLRPQLLAKWKYQGDTKSIGNLGKS